MKALEATVVVTFIICCESIKNSIQQEQRYDGAYGFQNQEEYRQEKHRPEIRSQRYRFIPQSQQNWNEDYMQYNRYQPNGRESIRTNNNYMNQYSNQQIVQTPVHQVYQDKKIIYQAVPYPVPVPDNVYHPTQKDTNNAAVEIQQSIPIYMARLIYQVGQNGALKLISEEELRNPGPDSNFNSQRLLPPLFKQYPILIVKHEQH